MKYYLDLPQKLTISSRINFTLYVELKNIYNDYPMCEKKHEIEKEQVINFYANYIFHTIHTMHLNSQKEATLSHIKTL